MSFTTAFHHVKIILRMMSDYTFLSSIESISFKDRSVTIKPGYWKVIVMVLKKTYNIVFNLGSFLASVKKLFIERYAEVSATHLKKFMLGYIMNSFYDYKNIIFYGSDVLFHGNPTRKNIRSYRKYKYYERKAKKHYLMFVKGLVELDSDPEPDIDDFTNVNPAEFVEPDDNDNFEVSSEESNSGFETDDSDHEVPSQSHSHSYTTNNSLHTAIHQSGIVRNANLQNVDPGDLSLIFDNTNYQSYPQETRFALSTLAIDLRNSGFEIPDRFGHIPTSIEILPPSNSDDEI